jgi:WD40 repeat protein
VWDADTGRQAVTLQGDVTGAGVAFSHDGARLACGQRRQVKLYDVRTGKELLAFVAHADNVGHVAFSPDGKRLATTSTDNAVRVSDATTGAEVYTFR